MSLKRFFGKTPEPKPVNETPLIERSDFDLFVDSIVDEPSRLELIRRLKMRARREYVRRLIAEGEDVEALQLAYIKMGEHAELNWAEVEDVLREISEATKDDATWH